MGPYQRRRKRSASRSRVPKLLVVKDSVELQSLLTQKPHACCSQTRKAPPSLQIARRTPAMLLANAAPCNRCCEASRLRTALYTARCVYSKIRSLSFLYVSTRRDCE